MNRKLLTLIASATLATMVGGGSIHAKTTDKGSDKVVIYLTRHGETTANVMHRAQGWSDYTLTSNGVKGAKYLGEGLKGTTFKAAYSGDLTRQEKTAKGALKQSGNKKVTLQVNPDLREDNYGSYEGRPDMDKNVPEIASHFGYKNTDDFMKDNGKYAQNKMQDGYYELDKANALKTDLPKEYRAESSKQVEKRMTQALTKIAKTQQKDGGGNVLVVSSGMAINLFLSQQDIPEFKGVGLENDAVTKLVYHDGDFKLSGKIGSLKYFNDGKKALDN
ncbi:histidine phosphatase family protein [Weissella bombi]|uniref:Probable phosphoglycerate mutase n=1 Tax=Weissella bombi TaxID=1505725 RepID=A0A1C3ZA01_9LACO|nr:histidine phosphatase family protein [Weissella bombi]SCB79093.1 probable phosphoglycerate mutase [Weissella bombi]